MVKAGEITPQEAGTHPHRNVLTRSVGTEPEVDVDEEDVPLIDGDRLLLCSDGLTGMVTEPQIQAILEAAPDPQDAADRLIKAANRAGGIDNITVVILDIHEGDDSGVVDRGRGAAASRSADPEERSREAASTAIVGTQRRAPPLIGVHQEVGDQSRRGSRRRAGGLLRGARLSRSAVVRRGVGRERRSLPGDPGDDRRPPFLARRARDRHPGLGGGQLPQYPALSDGITANDRTEAMRIVEQIRQDLSAAASSS